MAGSDVIGSCDSINRAVFSADTATDTGLQLGHLAQDLITLAQIVAIDVDRAGFIY